MSEVRAVARKTRRTAPPPIAHGPRPRAIELDEIVLASPRGFCAGVDRAIKVVEHALGHADEPVYVRHQIVHNPWVVEELRQQGARFVEELGEVPKGAIAIFSAHGVSPEVRADAERRELKIVDATCPLVSKVHAEVVRYARSGYTVLYVGHADHPEVVGVRGEAPDQVIVVESAEMAETVQVPDEGRVAYATQTTLSLDDAARIVSVLRRRFPRLVEPRADDICYATQNRQEAIRALAAQVEVVLVLGAPNSSNSNRLREVAERTGARAYLLGSASDLDLDWLTGARRVGVTAGASAPEWLVQEVVSRLRKMGNPAIREIVTTVERITFAQPRT